MLFRSKLTNEEFKSWDEWLIFDFIKTWNLNAKVGYKWEDNPFIFIYDIEVIKVKN